MFQLHFTPLCEESDDDSRSHQTPPTGARNQLAVPWGVFVADTLGLPALSESDTGDADAEPAEHFGDGARVGEPAEHGV